MAKPHLIQKFIFDVEFDMEEKAYQFQNQLSVVIKDKVVGVTDAVLTEFSDPTRTISIPRITLDLGDIPLKNLDVKLPDLLKEALTDKLRLLISEKIYTAPEEKVSYTSYTESELGALEYFIRHGRLPWSAQKGDPEFSIRKIFIKQLDEGPAAIKKLLLSALQNQEQKLRIIRQFEDLILWKAMSLFIESEARTWQLFYSDVLQVYQKKAWIKPYYAEYREMVWRFIIDEAVKSGTSKIALATVTERFLEFTSKESRQSSEVIVKEMYERVAGDSLVHKKVKDTATDQAAGYQKEFIKVIVDQIQKHGIVGKKENEVSSQNQLIQQKSGGSTEEGNSVREDSFENIRKEQLERKKKFVVSFFKILGSVSTMETLQQEVEKVEFVLKQLIEVAPVLVQRLFLEEVKLDVKELHGQMIVEKFSPAFQGILLQKIFKVPSQENYSEIKKQASRKAVLELVSLGYWKYTQLPLFASEEDLKKVVKKSFEGPAQKETQAFIELLIQQVSNRKQLVVLERYLSKEDIEQYFYTQDKKSEKRKSAKSKTVQQEQISKVGIASLNHPDSLFHYVRHWLKEKSLPTSVGFSPVQLIKKYLKVGDAPATAFLASLPENQFVFVKNEVFPALKSSDIAALEERRKEFQKETNELKKSSVDKELLQKKQEHAEEKKPFNKLASSDPVYIGNSGMVIFHPYLTRFFKMFDLIEKRAFKDEWCAHKAAHLLQYLVNKNTQTEEHDMVLNKLMCGIELDTPLLRDIEISEEDKKVCEGLIEGVIQNWTILKKTSNDNFRASFLIRDGRLQQEGGNWRLRVEEKGYDILVEKLPWSISIIKLPWMNHTIYVEWK